MSSRKKIVVLAGGTGSARFVRGLRGLTRFTVISNVGDNSWFHGLYVCPDIDIVTYTLAGIADEKKGWGIRGDRFETLEQLKKLGSEDTWFNLGDLDIATHIFRTEQMRRGKTLTEVTGEIASRLGVRGATILPATDQHVETHIVTAEKGELHLQEFWVKERGRPTVKAIEYVGEKKARPTPEVAKAIAEAETILISPGNPMTSILPIVSIGRFRDLLLASKARKVAVSPMIGNGAVSGPAAAMMVARRFKPSSEGVARLYQGLIDALVIDESDHALAKAIERRGISCAETSTLMRTREEETGLAEVALDA